VFRERKIIESRITRLRQGYGVAGADLTDKREQGVAHESRELTRMIFF
jgi:hypothetical protein